VGEASAKAQVSKALQLSCKHHDLMLLVASLFVIQGEGRAQPDQNQAWINGCCILRRVGISQFAVRPLLVVIAPEDNLSFGQTFGWPPSARVMREISEKQQPSR